MEENSVNLTFEELSILNERKAQLKKDHEVYMSAHPEIKTLLSSFMSAVLMEKPNDIYAFANEHFSALKPKDKAVMTPPLIIAGPSGVGKGTLINRLFEKYPNAFGFSVSHTTRDPRPGEVDGVNYHFSTKETMEQAIADGKFMEHAQVHGNIYGTSKEAIEKVQQEKKVCILDIDIQGVQQIKKSQEACKFIFIAPASMEQLEKQLRGRGTETEEKIALRLANAQEEQAYGNTPGNFDAILVNEDLDRTFFALEEQVRQWYPNVVKH